MSMPHRFRRAIAVVAIAAAATVLAGMAAAADGIDHHDQTALAASLSKSSVSKSTNDTLKAVIDKIG
jgi:hypothetical protein